MEGSLSLCFEHRRHTVLSVREQRAPLQVVRAFPLAGGAALVHLHNLSGGVLGGDSLKIRVEIGPRARAQLTTTGATRIYRSRAADVPAHQATAVTVSGDGLLEYLPDSLIPFAGSRYRQETRIDLAPGSGLFWWEIVAPGREARGECFAYRELNLRLDVWAEGRPIALERILLEPHLRAPASWARLGPYLYFATFYICRAGVEPSRWLSLEARLAGRAAALSEPGEILWAAGALPAHGLVVRALARRGRLIPPGLHLFWKTAKQELYGEDPIPPRKLK